MEYKVVVVYQKAKENCCSPEPPSLRQEIQDACNHSASSDYYLVSMSMVGNEAVMIFGRKR